MQVNMDLCTKCKWFELTDRMPIGKQLYSFCRKKDHKFSGLTKLSVLIRKEDEDKLNAKSFISNNFKLPQTCPYLLEHTISTEENKQRAWDSFKQKNTPT